MGYAKPLHQYLAGSALILALLSGCTGGGSKTNGDISDDQTGQLGNPTVNPGTDNPNGSIDDPYKNNLPADAVRLIEVNSEEDQFCYFAATQAISKLSFAALFGTDVNPASVVKNLSFTLQPTKELVLLTFGDSKQSRELDVTFEFDTTGHSAISQDGHITRPAFGQPDAKGYIAVVARACTRDVSRKFFLTVPADAPSNDTALNEDSIMVLDDQGEIVAGNIKTGYNVKENVKRVAVVVSAKSSAATVAAKYSTGEVIADLSAIAIWQDATTKIDLFVKAGNGTVKKALTLSITEPKPSFKAENIVVVDPSGYKLLPTSASNYKVIDGTAFIGLSVAGARPGLITARYSGGSGIVDMNKVALVKDGTTTVEVVGPGDKVIATLKFTEPKLSDAALIVSSNVGTEYQWRRSLYRNDQDLDGSPLQCANAQNDDFDCNDNSAGSDVSIADSDTPRLRIQVSNTKFRGEINAEHVKITGWTGSGIKIQEREGVSRIDDHTIEVLLVANGDDEIHAGFGGGQGEMNWPDYGDRSVDISVVVDASQFVDGDGKNRTGSYTFKGYDEQPKLEWAYMDATGDVTALAASADDKDGILNGEKLRLTLPSNISEWFDNSSDNQADGNTPLTSLDEDELFNDGDVATDTGNYRILVYAADETDFDEDNLLNDVYGIAEEPTDVALVEPNATGNTKSVDLTISWDGTQIEEDLDFYVEVYGKVFKYSQADELSTPARFIHVEELTLALAKAEHSLDGAFVVATLHGGRYFFDEIGPDDLEWELSGSAIADYGVASYTGGGTLIDEADIEIVDESTARIHIRWDGTDIDSEFDPAEIILTLKDNNGDNDISGTNLDFDIDDTIPEEDFDFEQVGPAEANWSTGISSTPLAITPEAETLTVKLITRHGSVSTLTEEAIDTFANAESAADADDGVLADKGYERLDNGQLQMILVEAKLTGAIWDKTADNRPEDFAVFRNKFGDATDDTSDDLTATPGFTIHSVSRVSDSIMEVRVIGSGADFDDNFQIVLGVKGTAIRHDGDETDDHIVNKGSMNDLGENVLMPSSNVFKTRDFDGDLYATDATLAVTATKESIDIAAVNITEKSLTDNPNTTAEFTVTITGDKWAENLDEGDFSLVTAPTMAGGKKNDCSAGISTPLTGAVLGAGGQTFSVQMKDNPANKTLTNQTITFDMLWDSVDGDFDSLNNFVSSDGNIYLQLVVDEDSLQDNHDSELRSTALIKISAVDEKIVAAAANAASFNEKGLDTANRETALSTDVTLNVSVQCSIAKGAFSSANCGTTTTFEQFDMGDWGFNVLDFDTDADRDTTDVATSTTQALGVMIASLGDDDEPQAETVELAGSGLTTGKGNETPSHLQADITIAADDPLGTVKTVIYSPNATFSGADAIDVTSLVMAANKQDPGTLGGIHDYMVVGNAKVRITYALPASSGSIAQAVIDNEVFSGNSGANDIDGLDTGEIISASTTEIVVEFDSDNSNPPDNDTLMFQIGPDDMNYGSPTAPARSRSEIIRLPDILFIAQDETN